MKLTIEINDDAFKQAIKEQVGKSISEMANISIHSQVNEILEKKKKKKKRLKEYFLIYLKMPKKQCKKLLFLRLGKSLKRRKQNQLNNI